MHAMPMPASVAMPMAWMPMCGQGWISAASSFLAMWTGMMAAMMLPSLAPVLWRYRQVVSGVGQLPSAVLTGLAAAGYFLVWTALGAAVFPLGSAAAAAVTRYPTLARLVPIATGVVILVAGAIQFTRWKAYHLACCRQDCRSDSGECGRALPGRVFSAWRYGMRLGFHCTRCCAGLTAALLVTGISDWPEMLAVTVAINLERLVPAGGHTARAIGAVAMGAGLLLSARAVLSW